MIPLYIQRISFRLNQSGFFLLARFLVLLNRVIFSCYLPENLNLPKSTRLGYSALGIVIHGRVSLDEDCHVSQNVTIGGTSKKIDVPTIGKRVYIGAGAVILGPVQIGDDCVIGANAVVTKSLPANSLAVGVPARIVKTGIVSSDYV